MGQTNPQDLGNGVTIDGDLVVSGDLTVSGGGSLSFDEIIEGTQVIDVTSTEALLVRKNGDGGDIFTVDNTNGSVFTADGISHLGDTDTRMYMGDDDIQFLVGNVAMVRMLENGSQDEVIINEDQADVDFRVESDGNAHALFMQASTGNIGINTNDPTFFFTAIGDATGDQATINQTHASYAGSALKIGAVRAANSAYNLLYCATGTSAAGTGGTAQFVVSGDGSATLAGQLTSDHHIISTSADEKGISIQNTANVSALRSLEMYIDANGKGAIRKTSAGGSDNDLYIQPNHGDVFFKGSGRVFVGHDSINE